MLHFLAAQKHSCPAPAVLRCSYAVLFLCSSLIVAAISIVSLLTLFSRSSLASFLGEEAGNFLVPSNRGLGRQQLRDRNLRCCLRVRSQRTQCREPFLGKEPLRRTRPRSLGRTFGPGKGNRCIRKKGTLIGMCGQMLFDILLIAMS